MLSEPPAQHGTWPALSCFSQADMEGRIDARSLDHSLGSRALVLRQRADPETAGTKVPLSGVNGRGGFSAFFCRASCFLMMRLPSCVPVYTELSHSVPSVNVHLSHRQMTLSSSARGLHI